MTPRRQRHRGEDGADRGQHDRGGEAAVAAEGVREESVTEHVAPVQKGGNAGGGAGLVGGVPQCGLVRAVMLWTAPAMVMAEGHGQPPDPGAGFAPGQQRVHHGDREHQQDQRFGQSESESEGGCEGGCEGECGGQCCPDLAARAEQGQSEHAEPAEEVQVRGGVGDVTAGGCGHYERDQGQWGHPRVGASGAGRWRAGRGSQGSAVLAHGGCRHSRAVSRLRPRS